MEETILHDAPRVGNPVFPPGTGWRHTRQQLREVFEVLDALFDLCAVCADAEQMIPALEEMEEIARGHFSEQERVCGFSERPECRKHREVHAGILTHMAALRSSVHRMGHSELRVQLRFIDRWLSTHAAEEAVRMMPCCQ